ncbi:MAG TPA: bifunctional serine/threonine-protein kinase/formylglycine-generating enzyme family protein [Verrucomicrobiae bacterium]|nr:bifunctional serine/threonine-protein kinase/formylglycine-generating enzyme family protein [Verrucomicrobiae bacterium]
MNGDDETRAAQNPFARGQKIAGGRFTLLRPIGRGGMGEVWLAQDERLHESVALKFLPRSIRGDATSLDDLLRETARSHKLSHPNIVRIHDLHEDGLLAFIAMEYVDGSTLASVRLQSSDRLLRWDYLEPLVVQLCGALEYAHGQKIIHRDLKPSNIMVDSRGNVKLADFGIAATVTDTMSRVSLRHATSGTALYMSPQQMNGEKPRPTDDIYAMGATLYELLSSKPPFYTGDISHQVRNITVPSLEQRLAELEVTNDVPPNVSALIVSCLAKDAIARPQSAAAFLEQLQNPAPETRFTQTQESNASAETLTAMPSGARTTARASDETRAKKTPVSPSAPHVIDVLEDKNNRARSGLKLALVCGVVLLFVAFIWLALKSAEPKPAASEDNASPNNSASNNDLPTNLQQSPLVTSNSSPLPASNAAITLVSQPDTNVVVNPVTNAAIKPQTNVQESPVKPAPPPPVITVAPEPPKEIIQPKVQPETVQSKPPVPTNAPPELAQTKISPEPPQPKPASAPAPRPPPPVATPQTTFVPERKPITPTVPQSDRYWVNTLGMRFVPVPGTAVLFAVTDTRVQDYQAFVNATQRPWTKPDFQQTSTHPAVNISWEDAMLFCEWLTEKERAEGKLGPDQSYRLPTDAEWSIAAGLETESGGTPLDKDGRIAGVYPWGNQWPPPPGSGNFSRALKADVFDYTSPVGSFKPNRHGLFDMGGNVRQWCDDWYANSQHTRVLRGSSWTTVFQESLLSSCRNEAVPQQVSEFNGFRCVLVPNAASQ